MKASVARLRAGWKRPTDRVARSETVKSLVGQGYGGLLTEAARRGGAVIQAGDKKYLVLTTATLRRKQKREDHNK